MPDVIVVGAGPAGTAAAKKCTELGLSTLILEKRSLPRNKVCDGWVMGSVAQTLIRQEFGEIPEAVLSQPPALSGVIFHVSGIGSQKLDYNMPQAWRRDLDYWMNQEAQAKGVEIWQGTRVTGLRQEGQGFLVEIEKNREKQNLEARFVVGGDGVTSIVRSFLFPELKVRYGQWYQQCYQGKLDLDKNYTHLFYPDEHTSSGFGVHHKGDLIVIDGGGRADQAKQSIELAKKFLAENYRLDITQKPVWRGGCLEPVLYRQLTSGTFLPAKGNILLVGDAAGLYMPITGEGMSLGIKSGLLAADAILRARESGEQADRIYLEEFQGFLSLFEEIYPWFDRIAEETRSGRHSLPEVLRDAYASTMRMF